MNYVSSLENGAREECRGPSRSTGRLTAGLGGAVLGALLGLALAILDQALATASAWPVGPRTPSVAIRGLGVLMTVGGYGAFFGVVSFGLRLAGVPRLVGALVQGAVVTLVTLLHAVSLALRVYSGSFLTVGAVEFCLNSVGHMMLAAKSDFVFELAVIVAVAISVGVLATWLLLRLGRWSVRRPRFVAGVGTAVVVPAMFGAVPVQSTPRHPLWRTTAELSFLASVGRAYGTDAASRPGLPIAAGPPLSAGAIWEQVAGAATSPRPNVILMTLESIRLDGLGYEGYARPTTPNLDRLAAQSVRFRRVWATATHSSYSQMAILSSLFPYRGTTLDMYTRLDYPRVLWHDALTLAGYRTATISSQNESWQGMKRFQDTATPTHFFHASDYEGARLLIGSERIMPDHVTVGRAMRWIEERGDVPWGLYLNLQSTHFSYRIPPEQPARFQPTGPMSPEFSYFGYSAADLSKVRNRYDSALAYVDGQIGRLRQFLEERGELDRTLWVVTADHGESFMDHGWVTHGRSLFDTEARVPLLLHFPERLAPRDVTAPISQLDLMPTLMDLLRIGPHPAFQGTSAAELARGRETRGSGKAVLMNIQGLRSMRGAVCWPYKLVFDDENEGESLYDLEADPAELDDRAEDMPEVTRALSSLLSSFIRAQREYHALRGQARKRSYAPRVPECPPSITSAR